MSSMFFSCLRPRRVKNKLGQVVYVRCGKCDACRNAKGSRLSSYCSVEQNRHKYTFFVTLTYKPEKLPTCRPFELNGNVYLMNECERLRDYYPADVVSCVSRHMFPSAIGLYYNKFSLPEEQFGEIPFLSKREVQNFMKRLRFYVSKYYTHEKIRYFACGEYGPKSFRPHYHLLLFTNSERLAKSLRWCVRASWRFGRVDIQSVKGGAVNYCAQYLNGTSVVSRLHEIAELRPFSLHSQHFAETLPEDKEEKIYENGFGYLSEMCVPIGNGIKFIPAPVSYERRLFPKSYAFSLSTHRERLNAYRLYETAHEDFAPRHFSVDKLAQLVIAFPDCHAYRIIHSMFRKYHTHDEDFEKCVHTCLLSSYNFIRLCRNYQMSAEDLLRNIEEYYSQKDYHNLRMMYLKQIEYLNKYEDRCFLVNFYDNADVRYFGKAFNTPDYSNVKERRLTARFFDSIGVEPYFVDWSNYHYFYNPAFWETYSVSSRIARDKVKHKYQNDQNLIFQQDG